MTKCHHNIDTSTVGCYICSLEKENTRLQEEVKAWQGRANANARDAVVAHEQLQHALNTLKWYAEASDNALIYDLGDRAIKTIERIQEGNGNE